MHEFDKEYWDQHWQGGPGGTGSMAENLPNPYVGREVGSLAPGTALDAGCGAGAEALWLASHGWEVTGADISAEALARAAGRAAEAGLSERVRWVEADLSSWEPHGSFDLVMTHYAHPAMPQLEFYERIASWVAPGGTLLIVGHLQAHGAAVGHGHGHGHDHERDDQPPAQASVTAAAVEAQLDPTVWRIVTAEERQRTLPGDGGQSGVLQDVVVRATRAIV